MPISWACCSFWAWRANRCDAPVTSGTINGKEFEWIADADSRIGPFLEVFVNAGYYWVPFNRLASVRFEEPVDLRDLVWAPAQFTWANGGQAVGFVPSRYPATIESTDPAYLLCRRTDWDDVGQDTYFGIGQRVLATDGGEYSLLDVRTLEIQSELADAEAPESEQPVED